MKIILTLVVLCAALHGETRYYLVEGAMELPGGRRVGTSVSIVKRVVDREAGRIEEVVLSLRGKEPAQEFVTLIQPEGETAKLSSPQGGFSGEGKLTGPAWAWTGMAFQTRLEKGGLVEGEDTFSAEAITAVKKVSGADGRLQIVIRETGHAISEPVYELLRSRLLAK